MDELFEDDQENLPILPIETYASDFSMDVDESDEANKDDEDDEDDEANKDYDLPEEPFAYISKLEFTFENICTSSINGPKKPSYSRDYTIENYLSEINGFIGTDGITEYAFRGSAVSCYEFKPSLFRNDVSKEKDYYHHVIRLAPEEFSNMSAFDVLCKMQHYSLPTRLLDLTSNPLIALWFACNGTEKQNQKNGKVEVINGKFHQSDMNAIQIICLIGDFLSRHVHVRVNPSLNRFRDFLLEKNIWCGDNDFVQYLQAILSLKFIGIRPDYSNPRLKAQQGLFMLFGIGAQPNPIVNGFVPFPVNEPVPYFNNEKVYTIKIPSKAKDRLRNQLEKLGFNKSRIFPELEHISEYVKNDLVKST